MNPWKRTLCLVICCTLLLGITAGTASATDPAASETIVHQKAVETVTWLGIMSEEEDGGFDPSGTITRAEMCKTICLLMYGGDDPRSIDMIPPFDEIVSSYPDVGAHWAAGYIEFGVAFGWAAGRGDGNFDPDTAVTGAEAAKMLLVCLNYDSTMECFTGPGWADAVNKRAEEKSLYAQLDCFDPSAALCRGDAAQMIYNTLNAIMVEYEYHIISIGANGMIQAQAVVKDYEDGRTLLYKKFHIEN